ncbi:MAG TPA: FHA domain-containing protein [Solirubrobacterales bacterium]|nr:FHA domain-containing protein [Solirubrobacterales bacterium]
MGGAALVIHEGAEAGSEHAVEGELILGREHGSADLVIQDPGVSRRHARVVPDNGALVVEDLGSSNGTYVNGERISGAVQIAPGDEIQIGATVLGIEGTAATAVMPAGAPPTQQHPGPAPAPVQPLPEGRVAPRRLAPHPSEGSNIPALSALFLGPLSILLLFLSSGGFFLALPCGIAAIILGTIGIRNVDRGRATSHRGLARLGRITGWIGTILSILALILFIVVATLLDVTADSADSISGLIDAIRDEIEGIEVPDVNAPDVNAPDVDSPDVNAPDSGGESGGESGGTPTPSE